MSAEEQTLSSLNDIKKFQRQNQRKHFVATCGQCQPGDTELKSDDREAETIQADSQGSDSGTKTIAIGRENGPCLEEESSSNKTGTARSYAVKIKNTDDMVRGFRAP